MVLHEFGLDRREAEYRYAVIKLYAQGWIIERRFYSKEEAIHWAEEQIRYPGDDPLIIAEILEKVRGRSDPREE